MSRDNGVGHRDVTPDEIARWEIVTSGASTYLGRIADVFDGGHVLLEPAYLFEVQLGMDRGGQMQVARRVLPLLMMSGPTSVTLRSDARVALKHALDGELREIAGLVKNAEAIRTQMRARHAGVVLAANGLLGSPGMK